MTAKRNGFFHEPVCQPPSEVLVMSAIRPCLQRILVPAVCVFLCLSTAAAQDVLSVEPPRAEAAVSERKASLETILRLLPPDRTSNGRVSFLDETFRDWLSRTGELPPDFSQLSSIPLLPDPWYWMKVSRTSR